MADLPTPDELVRAAQGAYRSAIDPAGTGAVNLRPGSRNDVAISALGAVGNRLSLYTADRVAASQLDSSSGEDLDALAADRFGGEKRKAGIEATGVVRLVRPGAAATQISQGSRFAVPAAAGRSAIVFEAAAAVASSATTALVPLVAQEIGAGGNLEQPADLTAILDPLPDASWAIDTAYIAANPGEFVFGGGALAETDDEFKARLRQASPEAMRQRGTRDAILAGALRVQGVRFATVIEPQDGTVVLYAGDASYALPDALKAAIDAELAAWRAFGVPVLVRPYNVQTVQVTATVHMARALANYDAAAIVAAAAAQIKLYFESRPQPDEYYVDAIEAAIFRADDEVQTVETALPAADVQRPADAGYGAVTALNRYRVTADSIALTVAPPLTV